MGCLLGHRLRGSGFLVGGLRGSGFLVSGLRGSGFLVGCFLMRGLRDSCLFVIAFFFAGAARVPRTREREGLTKNLPNKSRRGFHLDIRRLIIVRLSQN